MIAALLAAGIHPPFLGGDGWGDQGEEFYKILAGKQLTAYSLSHWNAGLPDAASTDFVKRYTKAHAQQPNDTAVLAYDSMKLLIRAILNAKAYTRDGIEDALNHIRTFQGITGHFRFTEPHLAPEKSIVLLKGGNGQFEVSDRLDPHFSEKSR